jgi:hopene-associated glycosyltransferase HpnB
VSGLEAAAALGLAAWLYLVFAHGRFWRGDQRLEPDLPAPRIWPSVCAVVPARNEADVIERSVGSLLDQRYPGPLVVVLVDDHSEDGTGDVARRLAAAHPKGDRLRVERADPLPPGWVGKMWAVRTGVARAAELAPDAELLLLTDADVVHHPDNLERLVRKATAGRFDLVSLMVRLHCRSGWERLLIPSFVYFFQKLYPFPRINDPRSRTAGAAGGCMLVRADALARAGGIESVRDAIIDDCTLGARLKHGGAVWVGLSASEQSVRPYRGLRDVWDMVARSAYTQLHYSPLLLLGTVAGLALLYLVPPLALLGWPWHGSAAAALCGAAAWGLMAWSYQPTLRLYGLPASWGLTLPLAGLLYTAMTVDSALRHGRGRGAAWKGRAGAGNPR